MDQANDFKFKKEKFYTWNQTGDEINLIVNLNTDKETLVDKNAIQVHYKTDFIEIKYEEQSLICGHLFSKIKPDESVWTLKNNSTNSSSNCIEVVLSKLNQSEVWISFLKDHDEFGEYKSEQMVTNELSSETKPPGESKILFSLEQQLEECDGLADDQVMSNLENQEKLLMLRRLDGQSHEATHQCYINDNKFLFEVKVCPNKCAALCLRHDVDGILWQPHRVTAPFPVNDMWLTHEHTFKAFG